jgi:hypothetical protein
MQHRAGMANSEKDEAFAARRKTYLEQDFDPGYYPSSMPLDIRLSLAAEYAAYQLGQMNRKLDRLVEAAERIARSLSRSRGDRRPTIDDSTALASKSQSPAKAKGSRSLRRKR